MKTARGFTLMEVLVALVLLSLFAVLAYRALDAVLEAQAHAREEMERWRVLAMAYSQVEGDLAAATSRIEPQDPVSGALRVQIFADGGMQFDLLRLLPADAPRGVMRVGYRCGDGRLSRLVWPDGNDLGLPPQETAILEGLESCAFRFMDPAGQWLEIWPLQASNPLPEAVELTLNLGDGQALRRVWRVQ